MKEAIKPTDPRIGHFIIALPILHLLFSSLFVWGYTQGFGAGISEFISATDVFTSAIRDMVLVYLAAAVIPGIFVIMRYAEKYPNAEARIEAIPDQEQKIIAFDRLKKTRLILSTITMLISAGIIGWQVWEVKQGRPLNFIALMPIGFFISFFCVMAIRRIWWMSDLTYELAVLALSTAITAPLIGMNTGHNDRYITFAKSANLMSCDKYKVIRSLSEYLIVITPSNSLELVDNECQIKFRVPNVK